MSFDKPTRNALAKMVSDCRRSLTADIRDQLQGLYGLQPDGSALSVESLRHLDELGLQIATELRAWQEHLAATEAGAEKKATAFERLAHETAFTLLNRLAALRMCEERGHVIECVRRGMESDAFVIYERFSGGALGTRGETYWLFLEQMFGELAIDLGVLFDFRAPQSLVFPRERCVEEVLTFLNAERLAHLWMEDETIGWIYQYFNSKEEREAMREASAAPRNSRELAVRNQFFTPRYIVEFLTDNTLGRIWYEMRKGQTTLVEKCRYLIRRPKDVFLGKDEGPPADEMSKDSLTKAEMAAKPDWIRFRGEKDPRDLRILDPACGSGHFLLYAFDLLETIYEEAWATGESVPSRLTGRSLRDDFPDLESLKNSLPSLILRHNLHGIDIDLRACQIAALALWLRAQQAFQRLGLRSSERPKITKSGIVCAESMPGEEALLDDLVRELKPRVLGQLVRIIFEKMKMAGEAGSLLKIEQEISGAIGEAKKQWMATPKQEQMALWPEAKRSRVEQMALFDISGITDEEFWNEAESRLLEVLSEYARKASNGNSYARGLFSEDAAQGFAFIDVCRNRYDVILMNPPFGESAKLAKSYIAEKFPRTKNDIYAAFVEGGILRQAPRGRLGAITSRTGFFLSSFEKWREEILLEEVQPVILADLGGGVLDGAMVETAAYVVEEAS